MIGRAAPAAALALTISMTGLLGAQQRPARALPKPVAELEEPLTGPLLLHELRDGRLLVHDHGEKRLVVVDLASGEVTDAARQGAGPMEYRSAMSLLRAPGDSVWLYDFMQSRVLVLAPDGKPARTALFADGENMMAMLTRPMVMFHDRAGNTYGELRAMGVDGNRMTVSDSVLVIRGRGKSAADTVFRMPSFMKAPEFSMERIRLPVPGFPPFDAWGVYPDGRVLVVRGATYTPELYLPDGTRRAFAPIPFPRVAITAADKAKVLDDMRRQIELSQAPMRSSAPAGMKLPETELVEPQPWQTHMPALTGSHIHIDDRGRAWVPVLDAARREGRYDLLDANGKVIDAVLLPKDARLLGFGKGALYITRKDADDLLYIQKVALP